MTFPATPLYEAFKLQLSLMMTDTNSQVEGNDDVLMLFENLPSTSPFAAYESCLRDH